MDHPVNSNTRTHLNVCELVGTNVNTGRSSIGKVVIADGLSKDRFMESAYFILFLRGHLAGVLYRIYVDLVQQHHTGKTI